MKWRKFFGVAIGFFLWWFLFMAIGIAIGSVWPEYREAARLMFQENDVSGFSGALLFANYFLFILSGLAVGLATAAIGRSNTPVLILSSIFFIYMVVNHYVIEWHSFPKWYNLIVPFIVAGSIYCGGRLKGLFKNEQMDMENAA